MSGYKVGDVLGKDVFDRAVTKAIANGWDRKHSDGVCFIIRLTDASGETLIWDVLDRGFAKALWGDLEEDEEKLDIVAERGDDGYENAYYRLWKKHLMQMVIADDPIKYLGEHI